MTTLHYTVGDASYHATPARRILAHVVNDVGVCGAGFTAALARRYPGVPRRYQDARLTLGQVQGIPVDSTLWIANLCAQHGLRSRGNPHPLQLDGLRECLNQLAVLARACEAGIQMPRIGCGLGGATWDAVEPLLHECLAGCTVYVYDPFQRGDIIRVIWPYQTFTGVVARGGPQRPYVLFPTGGRYLTYGINALTLVERRGAADDATLLRWVQEVGNG